MGIKQGLVDMYHFFIDILHELGFCWKSFPSSCLI